MTSPEHHRRSIRLQGFDYTQAGGYFVTLVAYRREELFGQQAGEIVHLNPFGILVAENWRALSRLAYVEPGEWVLMPNHLHGILYLANDKPAGQPPAHGTQSKSLGAVIQSFKSLTTRQINRVRRSPANPVWQRNYYEHIIRGSADLENIRGYILENPTRHLLNANDDLF